MAFIDRGQSVSVGIVSLSPYYSLPSSSSVHEYSCVKFEKDGALIQIVLTFFFFSCIPFLPDTSSLLILGHIVVIYKEALNHF